MQKVRVYNIEALVISEAEWRRLLSLAASSQDVKIKGLGTVLVLPEGATVADYVKAVAALNPPTRS